MHAHTHCSDEGDVEDDTETEQEENEPEEQDRDSTRGLEDEGYDLFNGITHTQAPVQAPYSKAYLASEGANTGALACQDLDL
jgi:hypothetical protein